MRYNDETSMEPHLQEEIQMLLGIITANFRAGIDNTNPVSRLGGICTAIHAFADEIWTLKLPHIAEDLSLQVGGGALPLLSTERASTIRMK